MALAIKKLSARNVDSEEEEPKLLFVIPSFFKEVQRVREGGSASPCLKKWCHLLGDESTKYNICHLIMARTYFIPTERHNIASSNVTGSIFILPRYAHQGRERPVWICRVQTQPTGLGSERFYHSTMALRIFRESKGMETSNFWAFKKLALLGRIIFLQKKEKNSKIWKNSLLQKNGLSILFLCLTQDDLDKKIPVISNKTKKISFNSFILPS